MNCSKKITLDVLHKNRLMTVLLVVASIGSSLIVLLPPQILRVIVDRYLVAGRTDGIVFIAVLYTLCFPLTGLIVFLREYLLASIGQKIVHSMRAEMSRKLTKVPATFFSEQDSASVTSRIINDVDSVNLLFSEGLVSLMIDSLKIVGILVSIFLFRCSLGVLIVLMLPFLFLLMRHFQKRIRQAQFMSLREMADMNLNIDESIRNRLTMHSLQKEKYMENRYCKVLDKNYRTMNQIVFYDAVYSPIIQIVTAAAIVAVFVMAGTGGAFGMTVGMVSAAVTLIGSLFEPIDSVGMELQSIQKGFTGMKSVDAFLTMEEECEKLPVPGRKDGVQIVFDHVSFVYNDDKKVLDDIHLSIKPGEKVVFVGRTGVGKTTLFRLIMGILRPTKGEITLNGVRAWQADDQSKRDLFGYVEQQFSFVEGTVADQISLGDEEITLERIIETMKFVGMHEAVMSLKDGYQTVVDEGHFFSKGQMQLLGIARAIVKDAPVLLLDEVTANLDETTEEEVVTVLKRAGMERTVLSVSHRIGSILQNGRMISIQDGSVVYDGPPIEV